MRTPYRPESRRLKRLLPLSPKFLGRCGAVFFSVLISNDIEAVTLWILLFLIISSPRPRNVSRPPPDELYKRRDDEIPIMKFPWYEAITTDASKNLSIFLNLFSGLSFTADPQISWFLLVPRVLFTKCWVVRIILDVIWYYVGIPRYLTRFIEYYRSSG